MALHDNVPLEQRLQESEERFRLIEDTAPVLIWMSGADKLCTYFNKPWLDFTGRSMEEELGNGWAEGVHPEDLQTCLATRKLSFDQRKEFRMEYRLRRRDGVHRWILDIGVPRFNQDGSFAGYIGIGVDVHDRRMAKERLNEYEKVVEGVDAIITVIDRQYRYVVANRKHLSMRGMTKEQVLGHHAREILLSTFDDVKEKLDESFRGNIVRFETKVAFPEIGERYISVSFFPVDGPNGIDRVACIGYDITERKLAEEALRKSEERLSLAIQAGRMYAYEWDLTTNVLVRSPEYINILGPTEPRIVSAQVEQNLNTIHPDDKSSVARALAECSPAKPTIDVTYRALVPGKPPIWLKSTGRAFFDGEGRMLRLIGMVADVTDQKLAEFEQQRMKEDAAQMNRATEMGQLVASLAHELAQPLAAVLSNAQAASRLASRPDLDLAEIKTAIADIIEDDQRASAVLNHVRTILKKHTIVPHKVNLNQIVEDVIAIVRNNAQLRGVQLRLAICPDAVLVQGDEVPLQQVLLNLVLNAMDAVAHLPAERRMLTVKTSVQTGNGSGVLVVEDEGPGIPDGLRARLFAPFFTTKSEGLGMGLAICSAILTSLGGSIDFQNRSERGATFQVKLPLASKELAA